jgi:hypothetical protein
MKLLKYAILGLKLSWRGEHTDTLYDYFNVDLQSIESWRNMLQIKRMFKKMILVILTQ